MKVVVCIGSSCHVKGSRFVVEELRRLIDENKFADKVELSGTFCIGKCEQGVCVTVDGKFFSVTPDATESFFTENILNSL